MSAKLGPNTERWSAPESTHVCRSCSVVAVRGGVRHHRLAARRAIRWPRWHPYVEQAEQLGLHVIAAADIRSWSYQSTGPVRVCWAGPALVIRNAHEACRLFQQGESSEQVNQQMSAKMGASLLDTCPQQHIINQNDEHEGRGGDPRDRHRWTLPVRGSVMTSFDW